MKCIVKRSEISSPEAFSVTPAGSNKPERNKKGTRPTAKKIMFKVHCRHVDCLLTY